MDSILFKKIEELSKILKEEIVYHLINANIANSEEERKRADRLSIFLAELIKILKEKNKSLIFDFANKIYKQIKTEQNDNDRFENADNQYILISILNLFPMQNTTNLPNYFDMDLSKKVIDRLNGFKKQ